MSEQQEEYKTIKRRCPYCSSMNLMTERRIGGNTKCQGCGYTNITSDFDVTQKEYKSIYQQAVEKYGANSQIDMLIEEMAELTVSLMHKKRKRKSNIEQEISHVKIMLRQMDYIFNKSEIVAHMITETERLKNRLKEK